MIISKPQDKSSDGECIFCKIIRGQIPSAKVYEDSDVLIINDIKPQSPIHLLAMPKKHIPSIGNAAQGEKILLGHLVQVIGTIAEQKGFAADGYRIVINNGKDAGQEVPHLHLHVLAGRKLTWPPG